MAAIDREKIDTGLLVIAFLLGILSSIGLKMDIGAGFLEEGQYPDWLPAVTSGFIIIAYATITLTSVRARLDPSQIGDNAYYLGFVLTLVALAVTLYEIGSKLEAEISDPLRDVIAGFGIALSSTIIGVCVRVVLLQYRVDIVARERELQLTLNDAIRRFHSEIEDVVRGTKYLGIEIRQSLEEHHQQIAQNDGQRIEKLVEDITFSHQKALDEVVKQITKVNETLARSTRDTLSIAETESLKILRELPNQVQQTHLALATESRSTADTLKRSLEQLNEVMAEGIETLRTQVQVYVKETAGSHAEKVKSETALIDESVESLKKTLRSFADKVTENLNTIEATITKFSDMNEQACQSTERLRQNLELWSEQVKQNVDTHSKGWFTFGRSKR